MKTRTLLIAILLLSLLGSFNHAAAQGTAFTYQGELSDSGGPINSFYDFTYTLYDSPGPGGNLIGSPNSNSKLNVPVNGGLFTNTLDFGSTAFTGGARWLQITVQPHAGGALTTLSPRQQLTPSPYAIFAANAGAVASGSVVQSLNSLKDNVTLAAGANVTITPNGNTLTIASAGVGGSGIWSLNGSSTYYNGGNVGIGTTSPGGTLSLFNSSSDTIFKMEDRRADGSSSFLSKQAFYDYYSEAAYVGLRHNGGLSPGVRALVFGLSSANSGPASEIMRITDDGNVGIGTVSPLGKLDVLGRIFAREPNGVNGINLTPSAGADQQIYSDYFGAGTEQALVLGTYSYRANQLYLATSGNVGIGTSDPQAKLHAAASSGAGGFFTTSDPLAHGVVGGGGLSGVLGQATSSSGVGVQGDALGGTGTGVFGDGYIGVAGYTTGIAFGRGVFGQANGGASSYGGLFRYGTDGNNSVYLGGNGTAGLFIGPVTVEGPATVRCLTITGGCDPAEPFDMSGKDIPKGAVVIIDENNPGQLKLSACAYDKRVAGIISGANGINPGISLHQAGINNGGENVALSGRVYALADASNGAIKPGDLLTTSAAPGHCMKVADHAQAQGAIIGKAMSALKEGKGMVLVLVTLQ
jgi:hypothetical protein